MLQNDQIFIFLLKSLDVVQTKISVLRKLQNNQFRKAKKISMLLDNLDRNSSNFKPQPFCCLIQQMNNFKCRIIFTASTQNKYIQVFKQGNYMLTLMFISIKKILN
ncbi:unnamed protein product [Paramecium octaurelia]|uniref:Uncharacterized protein n=1 Tax=Paramecium octaurelia TaxID=43137 RepID=A0A8S1VE10_PAROT|nr:unnamed protein product [Paramecium octaurelia]